ncbi:MAG: glycosyl hydrolase 115 family protein, partial [Paludibacter sp.]|nr:glycosyl hydrolase 115 family protein [Paludibacter sp.]
MKKLLIISILLQLSFAVSATDKFVFEGTSSSDFPLIINGVSASIRCDDSDAGVKLAVSNLYQDIEKVCGVMPKAVSPNSIIIGTLETSPTIARLVREGKISKDDLDGKREKFIIRTIENPINGVKKALVIAGSDKRGTIYGIYELSAQIGVSPWYYWADVPVNHKNNLYVKNGLYTDGEPAVELRGIFINDEAPAFQGWCVEKFGGVNSKMYKNMFELILRLKGNFLWPAMWGNCFFDDDPNNGALANEMGIVIGTSHHEPLGRAHDEWRRYGSGAWNYQANKTALDKFWQSGMERMKNWEKIVTIGMRGDGDEAMSPTPNIELLEDIVKNQRQIIENVTGKPAAETPQVWALYKEVQDYYDKGMRVPDDVTLLLCDDNWGNVRKLPALDAPAHKGGYGMYYHFDYVGGPRNYKWLNITPIQKTWQQMDLTYSHGVKKLWIVNVGDLKPMEYPISFFLDMAWNPKQFNANNLLEHTEKWCAQQFGEKYAKQAARIINLYTKYNRRVTPEMLNARTYSLENYNEFETVTAQYRQLALDAAQLYVLLPANVRDAYDQLVLFPVLAVQNIYEMYFAVAKNTYYYEKQDVKANFWADKVKEFYKNDSVLTAHYHTDIANGKWNHMMSQAHIGYTYWQQPPFQIMPSVRYLAEKTETTEKLFVEQNGYVSIEAEHYSKKSETPQISWITIPEMGKTVSAITT